MLQDDDTLTSSFLVYSLLFLPSSTDGQLIWTELKFPTHMPQSDPAPTPTIVHLSVRPFAPAGDTDLSKKKRGRGRGTEGNVSIPQALFLWRVIDFWIQHKRRVTAQITTEHQVVVVSSASHRQRSRMSVSVRHFTRKVVHGLDLSLSFLPVC
jgi:hypothetical protein